MLSPYSTLIKYNSIFWHSQFCHSTSCPPTSPLPIGNHWFVLYTCESASFFLFHSLVCCIFQIQNISDIIQYLSFSVWHITQHNALQVHLHCCKWKISFFIWPNRIPLCVCVCVCVFVCIHTTPSFPFTCSVDRHLGCFHTLAIVNKFAMNTEVCISFQINIFIFFFRYMPTCGITGSHGVSVFSFRETSILVNPRF